MARGGNAYQDVIESCADNGIKAGNIEVKNCLFRACASSGGKQGMASNSAVHELLECPVCLSIMYPPIHQCPNGHTICVNCKTKVHNTCPICRQELGNIRCLALEKVAESIELPCKYQSLGCQDILPYHSRLRHEENCKYRAYNCPYAGAECSATGNIPYLVAHLKADHNVDVHDGCTFNHRYVKPNPQEIDNATWMLTAGHSVHIAGLMRLDIEESSVDSIYVTVWASPHLPLHMGKTENACTMIENHFGRQLQPPIGEGRVEEMGKWVRREFRVSGNWWDSSSVDIAAAGLGWFAIGLKGEAGLAVWTYDGIDVIVRNALIPHRSHNFEVAGFTVSKIVSKADQASNKQCRNEKKRKLDDSKAEAPAASS